MTRTNHSATLPGTRWAVLALLTATAALAWHEARQGCHHRTAPSPTITRTAS